MIFANFNSNIPISSAKVVYFDIPKFAENKLILKSQDMLISIGLLDLNYDHIGDVKLYQDENMIFEGQMKSGILDGQGTIFENYKIKQVGQFSKNYLHGEIIEFQDNGNQQKKYYIRDREVSQEIYKQQISQVQNFYYSFYMDYNVNLFSYNALEPGRMLFENTVDYFIEYFRNYYESFRGKLITQLFNTSQTSDYISNDQYNQFVISQELNQSNNCDRYVFILNSQRSHFMIMIGDKGKLYQCDSLYMEHKNRETEFSKLLKFESNKCIKLNCTQQMNGFDCGIFAIYYALQFMKYDKLPIEQIEGKLQTKNIGQFRWQLKQLIKNNHNYILTNI